jgi:DNA-binding NtrC family response regulator
VEVRSKLGLGSTFQFTLPFQLSAQSGPNRSAQPRHLLLVDDNPSSLASLEMTLAAWGWTSVSVSSASQALAHLCSGVRFDVVLVDWQLPDMAGPDLISAVRQEFAVPLICMVNAYGRSKLTQEMSDAAAPEFLTKPVTASSLFDAVQTALAPATTEVVSTRRRRNCWQVRACCWRRII